MIEYRQPTVEQARAILKAASKDYRAACLRFWREHYGEEFVRTVTT